MYLRRSTSKLRARLAPWNWFKVSKGAKIRNRYNQVPHLTQDTNGKVTNSQLDTTNESQEVKYFYWQFQSGTSFVDHLCFLHAFASVHCCLVATCLERADLVALVGDVYCIFVTFPCGILGQVWYLIVSFPDLCCITFSSIVNCKWAVMCL